MIYHWVRWCAARRGPTLPGVIEPKFQFLLSYRPYHDILLHNREYCGAFLGGCLDLAKAMHCLECPLVCPQSSWTSDLFIGH